MSRFERFVIVFAFLCVAGFAHAIRDPKEVTTKPPKRREPVLPWYSPDKEFVDSSEDPSRSAKWRPDADNPSPRKPIVVNAETKTWSSWRKNDGSEIEQRTEIADDHQTTSLDQNRDYSLEYSQFEQQENQKFPDFEQTQERVKSRGKNKLAGGNDSQTKTNNDDYYEGISADSKKPRKEVSEALSTKPKSTVAQYDSRLGVQCPDADSTGQFVYPPDCKFFVNCWKGRAFVQTCAPGTLFNPDTLECDFPHKVKCYGGEVAEFSTNEHLDSSGRREPLLSGSQNHLKHERLQEPRCPPHITGLIAHPLDCTKFLQCANGGTYVMDCGPGTVFNPTISVCDWPSNVRGCEDTLKPEDATTTPLVPPGFETHDHKKLDYNQHEPVKKVACPQYHTGLLPHPDTCKKFLQCANGATFVMDCGPGTAFNPATSVCDWPHKVPGCSEQKPSQPATTIPTWSSGGTSGLKPWQQRNQTSSGHHRPVLLPHEHVNRPATTTNHPATDWDSLRPTWRPTWAPNAWTTPRPVDTNWDSTKPTWKPNTWTTVVPSYPQGHHDHSSHGNTEGHWQHGVDEQSRHDHHVHWDQTGSPSHPNGQWLQTNEQNSGGYHHHYHHHESTHGTNGNAGSQQSAPPYGHSLDQRPTPPIPGGSWQSGREYHEHQQFTPYDHSQDQRPTPPIRGGSWQPNWEHNHHHGKPQYVPTYGDSGQQQVPINQWEDGMGTPAGGHDSSTNLNTEFGGGNSTPNRRTEQELTPNRQEYSRNGPAFSPTEFNRNPAAEGNVYVDNDHKGPVDEGTWNFSGQTMRNRTVWSPSEESGTGTKPGSWNQERPNQPQNRHWDQAKSEYITGFQRGSTKGDDKIREWGSRTNIYQSTVDRDADSKLNQWFFKTNIFEHSKGNYRPEINNDLFNSSKPLYPGDVYGNTNGTRENFLTKEIEINQGHSKMKTYRPNAVSSPNYSSKEDQNIYIDSQSTVIPPSTILQPPDYDNVNDSGSKNSNIRPHGNRKPKYYPVSFTSPSADNKDLLAEAGSNFHRVIAPWSYNSPPSRSQTSRNSPSSNNYYPPAPASNFQPPMYDTQTNSSPTGWQYPPMPATDLQPPFDESPQSNSTSQTGWQYPPMPATDLQPPFDESPQSNSTSQTGWQYPPMPATDLQPPFDESPQTKYPPKPASDLQPPIAEPSQTNSMFPTGWQYPPMPATDFQPPFDDSPQSNSTSPTGWQHPPMPATDLQPPFDESPQTKYPPKPASDLQPPIAEPSQTNSMFPTGWQHPPMPATDLQPPLYEPSQTNSTAPIGWLYPAVPSTDLEPPYYESPSGVPDSFNFTSPNANQHPEPVTNLKPPDRFLVPPDPPAPNSINQNSNVRRYDLEPPYQTNDRTGSMTGSVSSTTQRTPDVHLVLPTKKKTLRTPPKSFNKISTTENPNIPSVSIEDVDSSLPVYESPTETPEVVEPDLDYDVDVLDDKQIWKPLLVYENKTTTTESSVIMKINKKKSDVDLFNIEAAPFAEEEPPFPTYYVAPVEPLDHSSKGVQPTPISGQMMRLRGGSGPHNGYVEVQGSNPGWGSVCDSRNGWTLREAHVVCRQLGYTRGAEMAWQGRNTRNGVPKWIAANSVSCQGNETRFQSCKFTHDSRCRVERDAIGVRCIPNRVAHCRKDEVPYEGQCYHLANPDSGLNHDEALDYCSRRQARLIDITNQAENNFVSEWLTQKHPEVGSIMTSGLGFTTMNRVLWVWEDSSKAKFNFTKWWPGWMEDKKHPPIVGSRPVCIVMKRKFPCHERPDSICVADYFFWDAEDCATSVKGHSYICERPYDDIGCIYGKGNQYTGNANVTASGKNCLPWNDGKVAHALLVNVVNRELREKLKTHSYCRNPNPNKETRPWCFTGPGGEREHCDIPSCGNIDIPRSLTTGRCKPKHFECLPGECIPSPWVCDGEEDCTNGADEQACMSHIDSFQKHSKHKLEGHDAEKWLNTPLKTCALRCKEADFTCRSFTHKAEGNVCLLSDSNIGMTGSLVFDSEFDYYEMKERSLNCDGMFVCKNQKCINESKVCDGKNDCNDRSDENICTVANLDYDIRLAGSNNSHEGRIEVKILGNWGQVCDDGFGMIDADVICKELGFAFGASEIRPGGYYGNLDPPTRFMVDQLECRGNETSLRECDFDGWGVHNCQPEEAVGVVCKTAVDSCADGSWKCDKSPQCIPVAFICDTVVDCSDGSDESTEHCDAPFEVRLANGSSHLEGRVEVRHHGIWGTVCDDNFSTAEASVICRSLGYGGRAVAKKNGYFGPGEGPIWLDEVDCFGNETQLYRCGHDHWGRHNCDHGEDAAVICTPGDVNDSEPQWDSESNLPEVDVKDILPAVCGQRIEDFNDDEHLIFQKVVRGTIAPKGSYPWQASIRLRGHSRSSHLCGAVILSPLHVLTAAHCLDRYNKGIYFVRAGDYNTEIDEGTEAEANIEDYYVHEDFRKDHRMNNDIAVVLLKGRGFVLGKDIMPICLPPPNAEYPAGLNCTISGFGSIETGTITHSKDLRYGWVPLLDQSVCRAKHVYGQGAISDGMVCAGYLDESVDTCEGDSGGPLACYHNGAFTLYGITSWGQHCGKANKPGVYVRVSHYRRWIDQKIRDSMTGS